MTREQHCLIYLHHEHMTDSCFSKDQQRTICGLEGCKKRHHPSLHSAPQGTVQAVQVASHIGVDSVETHGTNPGVGGWTSISDWDWISGKVLIQTQ